MGNISNKNESYFVHMHIFKANTFHNGMQLELSVAVQTPQLLPWVVPNPEKGGVQFPQKDAR